MNPADDIKLFAENLREAELLGEELLGERPAYKIIARVSGDMLHELLPVPGEQAGLLGAVSAQLFKDAGDLRLTLWVDVETQTLLKCGADLTEFMRRLSGAVDDVAARANLTPAEASALRVTLADLSAEIEYDIFRLDAATPFFCRPRLRKPRLCRRKPRSLIKPD
jgi:hypothetical protein